MKLILKENCWNGWNNYDKTPVKENEYEIKKDFKYIIKTLPVSSLGNDGKTVYEEEENFSFIITEIGSNYIIINTNTQMSEGSGAINLNSKEKFFKLQKDKSLILKTLTKDFGYIYTFTLTD